MSKISGTLRDINPLVYDKYLREIEPYDLVKIFHFIGPRKKKYYMYKWIVVKDGYLCGMHLDSESQDSCFSLRGKSGVLEDYEIIQSQNSLKLEVKVEPKGDE